MYRHPVEEKDLGNLSQWQVRLCLVEHSEYVVKAWATVAANEAKAKDEVRMMENSIE